MASHEASDSTPALIGRAAPLELLVQLAAEVQIQRKPVLAVVLGAAGIGKTALVDALLQELEQDCWLPALRVSADCLADAGAVVPSEDPWCLVVEDVHAASCSELRELRERCAELDGPVLIVVTARELGGEFDTELPNVHTRRVLRLEELRTEDARALAEAAFEPLSAIPDLLAHAVLTAAGGNPRRLCACAAALAEARVYYPCLRQGRWVLDEEKLARACVELSKATEVSTGGELSKAARRVLEQAAVIGSVFWSGALEAISCAEATDATGAAGGANVESLHELLGELTQRGHVLELPDPSIPGQREYVFKQTTEREQLERCAPAVVCRRRHRIVALWLKNKLAADSDNADLSAALATHLAAAGLRLEAANAFVRAGELARREKACARALDLYFRGLELLADTDSALRVQALHGYGDVLAVLGRTDAAQSAFREMLDLAYELRQDDLCAQAHLRIASLHSLSGQLECARYHFESALDFFNAAGDARGLAAVRRERGQLCWMVGDYGPALLELESSLRASRVVGDEGLTAASLNVLSLVWMDAGDAARASEALETALASYRNLGEDVGEAETLQNLGTLAANSEERALALTLFESAHAAALRTRHRPLQVSTSVRLGEAYAAMGRHEHALQALMKAERCARELASEPLLINALSGLASSYFAVGEAKAARAAIREALALAAHLHSKAHLVRVLRTLGELVGAGLWGPRHTTKAARYLLRSAALAAQIKTELELAKTCRSFCSYSMQSPGDADSAARVERILSTSNALLDRFRQAVRSKVVVAA